MAYDRTSQIGKLDKAWNEANVEGRTVVNMKDGLDLRLPEMSQTGEPYCHPMSNITRITEQFPDARYHEAWSLVTWHPTGILDNERADRVVDFLESEEQPGGKPFHRFTDLNGYARMRIGLDHIVRIARRRRHYSGPPVKSAFHASRSVSAIISRMFEELMDGSLIQVCTFRDLDAAADWLGVPANLLGPPE